MLFAVHLNVLSTDVGGIGLETMKRGNSNGADAGASLG